MKRCLSKFSVKWLQGRAKNVKPLFAPRRSPLDITKQKLRGILPRFCPDQLTLTSAIQMYQHLQYHFESNRWLLVLFSRSQPLRIARSGLGQSAFRGLSLVSSQLSGSTSNAEASHHRQSRGAVRKPSDQKVVVAPFFLFRPKTSSSHLSSAILRYHHTLPFAFLALLRCVPVGLVEPALHARLRRSRSVPLL